MSIEEQKTKIIKELQDREDYNSYQEELGFAKELNILRNDFYYQMICEEHFTLVDFMYHPLDVMSGDAYSARRIDEHITFYLLVDGMGKGMSASLTAMIMTSFVNHIVDKMIAHDSFDFSVLVHETMEYIKPIMLDEEALAIDYVLIDNEENMLYYAKFAMPAILVENNNGEISKIKSNNPPLCKYQKTFNISSYDISEVVKYLIYSDGIIENSTNIDDRLYSDFIEEDFLNAFTKSDFKDSFFKKIDTQDDDITLIFISRLDRLSTHIESKKFPSSLESIDVANEWYSSILKKETKDENIIYNIELVFTELFMNAFEHGNLGIAPLMKQQLLEDDSYFETLNEKGLGCDKEISVIVSKVIFDSINYIITEIIDEGNGFDTQILSSIFRNSQTFHGRGVFVSRKNSLGIYYNAKGNSVLYLNRI